VFIIVHLGPKWKSYDEAAMAALWRLVVRSVGSGRGLSDGGSWRLRGRDGVRAGPVKGLETEKLALPFDRHVVSL